MVTQVIKIDSKNIDKNKLKIAADALKEGKIVAFPTETVYGLGANALSPTAVEQIFKAKGRPSDNPLIVHISDKENVYELTENIPDKAAALMDKLWPGPLTLVFKKSPIIPSIITAGLNTVAVRMPEHPVARELIRLAAIPIAAPSANVSGKPSTTTAQHVLDDLDGKIEIVVDAGSSRVGLESTVLDVTVDPPMLLRPGGITPKQIEDIIGHIDIDKTILGKADKDNVPKSPGMKYKHYAPKAHVIIVKGENINNQVKKICDLAVNKKREGKKLGICATDQTIDNYIGYEAISMGDRDKPETIASRLFSLLREFDDRGVEVILAESVDENGVGLAIMNRMVKAAGYDIIQADSKNMKIVFVCTGNTCRSCMAEGIFRAVSSREAHEASFTAVSRGIHAFEGDPASEHSVKALKALWNIDISVHKAKMLDNGDVDQADLLLTMTRAHRDTLKIKYPDKQSNIFTLKEYAYPELDIDSNSLDISDPFGMPYQKYESCAKEIYQCVKIVLNKLR